MTTLDIQEVAKDLVMSYVHYVKKRVADRDAYFMQSGLDEDFARYEALFKRVFAQALGLDYSNEHLFSAPLVTELRTYVLKVIKDNGYMEVLKNTHLARLIFSVSLIVLQKVKDDLFD